MGKVRKSRAERTQAEHVMSTMLETSSPQPGPSSSSNVPVVQHDTLQESQTLEANALLQPIELSSVASRDNKKKPGFLGGRWTGEVHFYKDSHLQTKVKFDDLQNLYEELGVDKDGTKIESVTAFKSPLSKYQLTQLFMYHMFVVFKTNALWWSIEKLTDRIVIQQSKDSKEVEDCIGTKPRNKGRCKKLEGKGASSVKGLVDWLKENREPKKKYHLAKRNCQHFAKDVFKKLTKVTNAEETTEIKKFFAPFVKRCTRSSVTSQSTSDFQSSSDSLSSDADLQTITGHDCTVCDEGSR